jgi:hypothetical protein
MTSVSLPLPGPLREARFLERPNRFIVHARLRNGREVVAHLADPGRLLFERLLEDPHFLWLSWQGARLVPFDPPPVGFTHTLPAISLDTTLRAR